MWGGQEGLRGDQASHLPNRALGKRRSVGEAAELVGTCRVGGAHGPQEMSRLGGQASHHGNKKTCLLCFWGFTVSGGKRAADKLE